MGVVEEVYTGPVSNERYEKNSRVVEISLDQKEAFYSRFGHSYNGDNADPVNKNFEFVWQKALELSYQEAIDILTEAEEYHDTDSNLSHELSTRIHYNLTNEKAADEMEVKSDAAMIRYWSPYAEVRSVTDPYDDHDAPIETIR
ncbi:hypothetical protein AWJ20_2749 [Sugiyamaella lignohabitans]|uniref:Uncharacterized protein n=1 Tax=Sugiyamaella lignohabitans TaxID=796027 RepID=A0A167FCS5_9ASCO|nr:uncharacterized protein AWJ20_2749 [Sugiyamaella lignohabitans]ANB15128.1 hypothetical protein AWJ20_2749 [Sugiyamaella lignohabitans]